MSALTAMAYTKIASLAPVLAENTSTDIGTNVGSKFTELYNQIKNFATPAATFAIAVCAIYLVFGSDPSWIKKAKSWGIAIFFGLVILYLAPAIVGWVTGIAG